MTAPQDELTPELAARLRRLAREEAPAPNLEERVVGALRAERGVASRRKPWTVRPVALGAAAATLIFVVGLGIGSRGRPSTSQPTELPRFALFLYEAPSSIGGGDEHVAEYKAWVREIAKRGRLITGEKLQDRGLLLSALGSEERLVESADGILSGYFVIQASSLVEALEVARSCPHLRHHGRISLRPIDPV